MQNIFQKPYLFTLLSILTLGVVAVLVWNMHFSYFTDGTETTPAFSESDRAYRETVDSLRAGNIMGIIVSIRALKVQINDENTLPQEKAKAIGRLALWYQFSGYDIDVFKEIFLGTPYSEYKVDGDTAITRRRSIGKLLLWSLEIHPLASTATAIAKNYLAGARFVGPEGRVKTIESVEMYLNRAAELDSNVSINPTLSEMAAHSDYLYDRALIVGELATLGLTAHANQYRSAYGELFLYIQNHPELRNADNLARSHWRYAEVLLRVDKDTEQARMELDTALELAASSEASKNALIIAVRQLTLSKRSVDITLLQEMADISPAFKNFVEAELG